MGTVAKRGQEKIDGIGTILPILYMYMYMYIASMIEAFWHSPLMDSIRGYKTPRSMHPQTCIKHRGSESEKSVLASAAERKWEGIGFGIRPFCCHGKLNGISLYFE